MLLLSQCLPMPKLKVRQTKTRGLAGRIANGIVGTMISEAAVALTSFMTPERQIIHHKQDMLKNNAIRKVGYASDDDGSIMNNDREKNDSSHVSSMKVHECKKKKAKKNKKERTQTN